MNLISIDFRTSMRATPTTQRRIKMATSQKHGNRGGKSRGGRPTPRNAPSKTGNKSGGNRGNNPPRKK